MQDTVSVIIFDLCTLGCSIKQFNKPSFWLILFTNLIKPQEYGENCL